MPLLYTSFLGRTPGGGGGGGGGDPHWDNVVLLAGFEGSDGETSSPDESQSGHSLGFNGDAQLDTAQQAFGVSSLLLDGSGDFVQAADHDDFDFGGGDFTLETLVRFSATSGSRTFLSKWVNAGNQKTFLFRRNQTAGDLQFFYSTNGSGNTLVAGSWAVSTDTWYHVVSERSGDTLRLYAAELGSVGSVIATADVTGVTFFDSTAPVQIAALEGASAFAGWMDEVRLTKGVARYQGTLPALTEAFPRVAA
jgi:hypothetical protein